MIIPHQLTLKNVQEAFESIQQELNVLKGNITNNTLNITSVTNTVDGVPVMPLTDTTLQSVDSIFAIEPPGNATDSRSVTVLDVDNHVRMASRYSGADAAFKIGDAVDDLPVTGGTVDATGLEGPQTWSFNPFENVTKPITFIMGAGITTIPIGMTIPDGIDIIMPSGAIFHVADNNTLQLHLSSASSLSQHFSINEGSAIPGEVVLRGVSMIHTRWFDDGGHDDRAVQRAINTVEGDPTIMRAGSTVWIDDVMTLLNTLVIAQKAFTLDCGGITSLSAKNPPATGGFIWGGPADYPMLEIKSIMGGLTIQNSRFYGNPLARPRSAISLVDRAAEAGIGSGRIILRNLHIGMQFGDNDFAGHDYTAFDSLVNGIYIGDTYDGGDLGTNDDLEIDSAMIWGVTEAAIRQGSGQNSLGNWRNLNIFACTYAFRLTSVVSIHSSFAASCSGSFIYTPLNDDYGVPCTPVLYGFDLECEQAARYILMDGAATINIKGGNYQIGNSIAADKTVILGNGNYAQSVYLRHMMFQDIAAIGAWNITMVAGGGQSAIKMLRLHYGLISANEPTITMYTQNKFDQRFITKELIILDSAKTVTETAQYPISANLNVGYFGRTVLGTFDESKYHIPNAGIRGGDVQNGSGAWEISTAFTLLATTSGTTVTATGLIPANVLVLGVTTQNISDVTVTGGTIKVGTLANPDKWNANLATGSLSGATTETTLVDWNLAVVGVGPYYTQAAENVVVSVTGGNTFTAGSIRVCVHYLQFIPPVPTF